MTCEERLQLIARALAQVETDESTPRGSRIYLAYLVAREGLGVDSMIGQRIAELRQELGL